MSYAFVHCAASKCVRASGFLRSQNGGFAAGLILRGKSDSGKTAEPKPEAVKPIVKSVFISQSRDVFTNLALEHWMYKNFDFTDHHIMLLWRNSPCVIIGRHQNPWLETNVDTLEQDQVVLARRNSGGGTVFHDEGNLNITFFCPKERYNRKKNLQLLAKTLEREWNLFPEINNKEDIIVDGEYKISGTASKIGRLNSYHHCTLMVDVNKDRLRTSLNKNESFIVDKKSTKSDPSQTVNLGDLHSGLTIQKLMAAVGWQYMRTDVNTQKDCGWQHVQKQRGFQMVNPSEEWFPGIEKIRDEFSSWDWTFGKTSEFEVKQQYDVGHGLVAVKIGVERGKVNKVSMSLPEGISWGSLTGDVPLVTSAVGQPYSRSVFSIVEKAIKQQPISFSQEPIKQAARL